jgi:hypothetical protein
MVTSENRGSRWRLFAILILPLLHLCVCMVVAHVGPNVNLEPIIIIDAPFSLFVLLLMGWDSPHPLIWFGVLGTLWWYLLARFVELETGRLMRYLRKYR